MYGLESILDMVYFPAFSVSMFVWSLRYGVSYFISLSAASNSHGVISGQGHYELWYSVHCHVARSNIPLFVRFVLLFLPKLSTIAISLFWRRVAIPSEFLRLFGVTFCSLCCTSRCPHLISSGMSYHSICF